MGTLRIIAGELRGRRIRVPATATVRPTAERAREALFSILAPVLPGAVVLDAYAGSGALGFEALSRGAARAVFVEADGTALGTLGDNVEELGLADRCQLLRGRVEGLLRAGAIRGPFGLVFADPPYGAGEREPFLGLAPRIVAAAGIVVLERDAGTPPAAARGLEHYRTAAYGRCRLDFYRPRPEAGTAGRGPEPG